VAFVAVTVSIAEALAATEVGFAVMLTVGVRTGDEPELAPHPATHNRNDQQKANKTALQTNELSFTERDVCTSSPVERHTLDRVTRGTVPTLT
jgi:hypothetical protein